MSYFRKIEYRIIPDKSFDIIYSCSGCGCKTSFQNTNRFRVNANGNKLDIWLIYQCSRCKHTKNLAIYERQNPAKIPKEKYQLFLANDERLAMEYGTNYAFFRKNQVEVDGESICYHYEKEMKEQFLGLSYDGKIQINNPYGLKLRPEKVAAEMLQMSRSQIKKLLQEEQLRIISIDKSIEITLCKV